MSFDYNRIPEELRWTAQWCVAGIDEKGTYKAPTQIVGNGVRIRNADPTNPRSWSDFETVREYAEAHPPHGIGFVMSAADPYVCIDLDIKNATNEPDPTKWTKQENIDRFHKIVMSFHSYTERSTSGQGYHIWVRGHTGRGARRDGVEVYSQERFMVFTGDVVIDTPIAENQDLLDALLFEMRRGDPPILTLVDNEQTETDEVIYNRATNADNAQKFYSLWNGDWAASGYPSQSEADIALLTMLAFYCKSNSQVFRLFRLSQLGKREKAVKNDYYLGTSLKKVRSIAANEQANNSVGERMAQALVLRLVHGAPVPPPAVQPQQPQQPRPAAPPLPPPAAQPPQATPPQRGNIATLNLPPFNYKPEVVDLPPVKLMESLQYPPGIVGEIARHIYDTSPRPIREVSIVAALGLMAGVCGRAFHIPQSGLNLYIILVGQSAIGKEAMHSGISGIIKRLAGVFPGCTKFVDFSDYVSSPALTKAIATNPAFVNIAGEFGKKLQRMANDGDAVMQQLRTVMTNLYQKSGPGSVFGGLGYSDKDKNVASVSGVAYSMIGETTPGTFYDSLTDTMMADGFMSRFTVVEFVGERPPQSENFEKEMNQELVDRLAQIFMQASVTIDSVPVPCDSEAGEFLRVFDKKCDKEINNTKDEGWRQMWNRAHLKVFRISAILAVCDNHCLPLINLEHVMWAYDLIMRDINIMTRRMKSGEVGTSDATRENKLLSLCKSYLTEKPAASYGIDDAMHVKGIVPRKFFQVTTQRVSCFTTHKLGQIAALDITIRSLVDGGYLTEMAKTETIQHYGYHGKSYRIVNLPMSSEELKALAANSKAA